jgi:ribulose-5-phosphate 4-epimerase/fuculose-1-phosphate aldolase
MAEKILSALKDRKGCLMGNHGAMTIGGTGKEALDLSIELENLCNIYWRTMQVTCGSNVLSSSEMADVHSKNATYGQGKNDVDGNDLVGTGTSVISNNRHGASDFSRPARL